MAWKDVCFVELVITVSGGEMQSFLQLLWGRGNSLSNYAPVQVGSTPLLRTIQLTYTYQCLLWHVFYLVVQTTNTLKLRLWVKLKLFMCYSLLSMPSVFMPFAHQTAAIIRAGWVELVPVASSCRTRLLFKICSRIGYLAVSFFSQLVSYPMESQFVFDVVVLIIIRNALFVYLKKGKNLSK